MGSSIPYKNIIGLNILPRKKLFPLALIRVDQRLNKRFQHKPLMSIENRVALLFKSVYDEIQRENPGGNNGIF